MCYFCCCYFCVFLLHVLDFSPCFPSFFGGAFWCDAGVLLVKTAGLLLVGDGGLVISEGDGSVGLCGLGFSLEILECSPVLLCVDFMVPVLAVSFLFPDILFVCFYFLFDFLVEDGELLAVRIVIPDIIALGHFCTDGFWDRCGLGAYISFRDILPVCCLDGLGYGLV